MFFLSQHGRIFCRENASGVHYKSFCLTYRVNFHLQYATYKSAVGAGIVRLRPRCDDSCVRSRRCGRSPEELPRPLYSEHCPAR